MLLLIFITGTTMTLTLGGGEGLLKGLVGGLVGALLSVPAAKMGEGLKKIGVPGPRIPPAVAAAMGLAGYGLGTLGDSLGGPSGWRDLGAHLGTQAGLMSAYAHDQGWTGKGGARRMANDVSTVILPKKEKR